jgi:hypothetical protein
MWGLAPESGFRRASGATPAKLVPSTVVKPLKWAKPPQSCVYGSQLPGPRSGQDGPANASFGYC